ncbi:C4-dicarboxylate ABC transporter substrate-binding protein [Oceanobacillus oncorhynchi subsp. incaldanensis]|uniref:TAXI family TRAP transporter solute-binding subunit n=1 Tax=Oceanobacillus oncorhynchi TaxID=545501 RepID=UPI001B0AF065|nr:TAXI family TRAP transporter solute-binding subunit [Oceanobacillus oncorhynchi]GIO19691.1 C4-dicarboxylate ABC transporter substrate-binding protein [Oceanobacillus oncorhynchi subsp. incaldanensis]
MFKILNIIKVMIIICVILVFAYGCSNDEADGSGDSSNLLLGTSSQGGTYYVWGGGWADIIGNTLPEVDVSVEVSGGPASNVQLIQSGEMDLGFVTTWLGAEGYNGEGWTDVEHDKVRSMFIMYPSVMHMYSLQGNGIETIADFSGNHVSTGPPGSTSAEAGEILMNALGIEPGKVSNIPTNTAVDGLRDGTNDAGFAITGLPGPFMLDLETTHDVQHIGLSDQEMETVLSENPYWDSIVIPEDTYQHLEEDISVVAFWNLAVASEDLSEDLVYDLVKTTFEKHEELLAVDPTAKDTIAENITYSTVPLHPGAIKYYEEQGIDIPDDLIPPEME